MSDNPSRQTLVNDIDLSSIAITTSIELLENGVPIAVITADNEDAAAYLAKLHIKDEVVVKGLADSAPPTPIDWSTVLPCFRGDIQQLVPVLTKDGQVCQVIAFGKGYQIKEMRVNTLYGKITPVPTWNNVYDFDSLVDEWDKGHGAITGPYSPYLNGYKQDSYLYLHILGNQTKITAGYTFGLNPDYNNSNFLYAKLHVLAALYSFSGSGTAGGVRLTAHWTTDLGNTPTWHSFTDPYFHNDANTQDYITAIAPSGGTPEVTWDVPIGYIDTTYYPPSDYDNDPWLFITHPIGPPYGNDYWLDITPDIPVYNSNFRVKIGIAAVQAPIQGGISINMMYLNYQLSSSNGKTVRELLAGDNYTNGVIPKYVNSILNDLVDIATGYDPVGVDYIYKDDNTEIANLIPELKLPYNDAFMAIQDIIKYGSGLKFLQHLSGYHWTLDTLGNLLLAPLGVTHHFEGKTGYYVDAVPNTIPWVARPYATPIVVRQDMFTLQLKHEVPIANLVLVSGKYQFPFNDTICTDPDISPTGSYPSNGPTLTKWYSYGQVGTFGERRVTSGQSDIDGGGNCLSFYPRSALIGDIENVYIYGLPADLDFTQLMGREIEPEAFFMFKATNGITDIQFRLYWDDGTGQPDINQYLYYKFGNGLQSNLFNPVTVPFPNTKYYKNFNGWGVGHDNATFQFGYSTSRTIEDIKTVKYMGIAFKAAPAITGPFYGCRMSKFTINGSIIRGAYDSLNINGPFSYLGVTYANGFGCRMITIKNSMANSDTLDPNDNTSPLSLETIYELQRNRIPFTTGEIAIPFDPVWIGGQQVWIQAEDVIPIGVEVMSGAGVPTTSTGTDFTAIGSYYVRTTNYEVYLCTEVTGEYPTAVYTWVDQSEVRYKINTWFRIIKVTHTFNHSGAFTRLMISNDLYSSIPVQSLDAYTVTMRAINPDFQSHTTGSLKSYGDFDQGLTPIVTDFSGY